MQIVFNKLKSFCKDINFQTEDEKKITTVFCYQKHMTKQSSKQKKHITELFLTLYYNYMKRIKSAFFVIFLAPTIEKVVLKNSISD